MKTNVKNILLNGTMACALAMLALGTGRATAQTTEPAAAKADPNAVTAIDILLEPDATIIQRATATNDRLSTVFPKGFAPDASHRPHTSWVPRFVLTENLDKVSASVRRAA